MVLFGIVGEMGCGKTLTCTYLGFKNWYFKRQKIYSNYHLFKIPYYYIESVRQFDYMREGVVLLDEIWRICDARLSRKSANKFVADILARSRKRDLVYIFTAQVIDTIDKRIRKVMDFTSYAVGNRKESVFKVLVFRTGYAKTGTYMKTFYYTTEIPKICYSTNEEVDMIDDSTENEPAEQPKLIWQEGAMKCKDCGSILTADTSRCNEKFGGCGSYELTPIKPIYFDKWQDADLYAQKYWEKWFIEHGYTIGNTLS
jgi:hypothetical protein